MRLKAVTAWAIQFLSVTLGWNIKPLIYEPMDAVA
jgi:hypothetical protein